MSCVIKYCHSSCTATHRNVITFHRFPNCNKMQLLWIQAIGKVGWTPMEHHLICSRHFSIDCFIFEGAHKKLSPYAVPTLYLNPNQVVPKMNGQKRAHSEELTDCLNCEMLYSEIDIKKKQLAELEESCVRDSKEMEALSQKSKRLEMLLLFLEMGVFGPEARDRHLSAVAKYKTEHQNLLPQ